MKQGGQGLQDYYLNQLRKEKILATVFLTNGFQLRGRVVSFDNFTALLDRNQKELTSLGYGLFAIEVKSTNEFIGFTGLHEATFEAEFTPCIEIGWRLKRSAWNQGFATEAALGVLAFAKGITAINEIYSFTATCNKPSEKVMRKIHLTKIADFEHPALINGNPLKPHVLYKA